MKLVTSMVKLGNRKACSSNDVLEDLVDLDLNRVRKEEIQKAFLGNDDVVDHAVLVLHHILKNCLNQFKANRLAEDIFDVNYVIKSSKKHQYTRIVKRISE